MVRGAGNVTRLQGTERSGRESPGPNTSRPEENVKKEKETMMGWGH